MPFANKLTVQLMAVIAENEREMISKRTKEALAAAKARKGADFKIGNPNGLSKEAIEKGRALGLKKRLQKADEYCQSRYPIIKEYLDAGLSLRAIAKRMTEMHELTPRMGSKWTPTTVSQILKRVQK